MALNEGFIKNIFMFQLKGEIEKMMLQKKFQY